MDDLLCFGWKERENGGLRGGSSSEIRDPLLRRRLNACIHTHTLEKSNKKKNSSTEPVPPMQFLMLLRQHFPQFAQQARGKFMQQDAEEFMGALFGSLAQVRVG